MSMFHKFYMKQMNLELEVVQSILAQKKEKKKHFWTCLLVSYRIYACFMSECLRFFMYLNNEF